MAHRFTPTGITPGGGFAVFKPPLVYASGERNQFQARPPGGGLALLNLSQSTPGHSSLIRQPLLRKTRILTRLTHAIREIKLRDNSSKMK